MSVAVGWRRRKNDWAMKPKCQVRALDQQQATHFGEALWTDLTERTALTRGSHLPEVVRQQHQANILRANTAKMRLSQKAVVFVVQTQHG